MSFSLAFVLYSAHLAFSAIGLAVITVGVVKSTLMFLKDLFANKKSSCFYYHSRIILCSHIIFGMEFMVASDIIRTMAAPDYMNLIILAGLVGIRTVLSFFLTRESNDLIELHKTTKCSLG
jgi:uncharacterized membrane protein